MAANQNRAIFTIGAPAKVARVLSLQQMNAPAILEGMQRAKSVAYRRFLTVTISTISRLVSICVRDEFRRGQYASQYVGDIAPVTLNQCDEMGGESDFADEQETNWGRKWARRLRKRAT